MTAWKFLGAARLGLYSGFSWPLGEWVEVSPPLVPSRRGIHACRVGDLPHWIDDELWTIELDGEIVEAERTLVASRGRLAERVPQWNAAAMGEFARACVDRRRELPGLVEDAEYWDYDPPSSAYMAAHAAGLETLRGGGEYWPVFHAERAWQAEWLAGRLGLV